MLNKLLEMLKYSFSSAAKLSEDEGRSLDDTNLDEALVFVASYLLVVSITV